MPDRKMRDAGRNRREDPATLIVSRKRHCRGHHFCLCRRWDPHFPVRQKDLFIIFCVIFLSGNSLFYPYGRFHTFRSSAFVTVDRKSTRLNSSHQIISYAVFCLKKKKTSPARTVILEHTHLVFRHGSGYTN